MTRNWELSSRFVGASQAHWQTLHCYPVTVTVSIAVSRLARVTTESCHGHVLNLNDLNEPGEHWHSSRGLISSRGPRVNPFHCPNTVVSPLSEPGRARRQPERGRCGQAARHTLPA